MHKKIVLFSLLAITGIVVLAVASVTVYALGIGFDQTVTPSEQVKVAPIQVAPAEIQTQQVKYESHSFGAGGCSHSAKMEMVQKAEESKNTSTEQLLTQAR